MTTIGFTVGTTAYSDYVFQADLWRDTLAGIGRWEVQMDPLANYWPQDPALAPDTGVTITIDGVTMMLGYIDDVDPYLEGVDADLWKLAGRDYGLDLAELFYTAPKGDYVDVRGDDILNRVFTAAASEITPPAGPFTAPILRYEWKPRTYLGDGTADICKILNYDFYVEDNVARDLHFFPIGDAVEHTTVDLTLIPNSLTNNILKFEMGERRGGNVKNYVVASAGGLKDHWTDLNSADWTPRATSAVTDFTAFLWEGKASLQVVSNVNNSVAGITLDFAPGLYGYTSVDMSEPCMGTYAYLCHYPIYFPIPGVGTKRCYLQLEDVAGARIMFYRTITAGLARNSDATQTGYNDEEQIVTKIPFGEQDIELALGVASTKGYWYYISLAPPVGPTFDWSQVEKIHFTSYFPIHATDYFLVDALEIPSVEVISVSQDAGSQASYGIRMMEESRPDIRSQYELDDVATDLKNKYRYPLETLHITAIGQTGSQYAGQSLDVRADQFGLTSLTKYRIVNLHHMVRRTSSESDVPGWTFLTEYDLIRHTRYAGGTQQYSGGRYLTSMNAALGYFNWLRGVTQFNKGGGVHAR